MGMLRPQGVIILHKKFRRAQVHDIAFLKGVLGLYEFHRIAKLPPADQARCDPIERAIKDACNRSNHVFFRHDISSSSRT